ncbi:MAG: hypothetical protein QHJ73_07195, partial [Armatimonadota bacterium]|nr:hypothetical protein [Armatimonadota bacterium]
MGRETVAALLLLLLSAPSPGVEGAPSPNLLQNPNFAAGSPGSSVPPGWRPYGGGASGVRVALVPTAARGHALLLEDDSTALEIGVSQTVPATPGETYQASAWVRPVEGFSTSGAYLQLRFQPGDRYVQTALTARSPSAAEEVSVRATAPPEARTATVYLYTHREPTPHVLVERVALVSGVPPPLSPLEVKPPVYTKLKELYRTTAVVRAGKPNATIVAPASGAYRSHALRLQATVRTLTGVTLPIATDDGPEAALPLSGHRIALGNRSTNRFIEELYNRGFTLLDLRYPGAGGYEVRSLHNPTGGGYNVIFAGGSDASGVEAAVNALIEKLRQADAKPGELSLGWLMEIHLGKDLRVPTDFSQVEVWEASAGYRSVGYFGWNSISKRMALYYMTGDPFHAREALRLSFPDAQALAEITRVDEERIENKKDPLAGPYHYNAHLMILFWDLIEESPVFTDEERLRVTNAFARQLDHRKSEGILTLTAPPEAVGSRHGQWSAVSLFCLARYFQRDYPDRVWQQCLEGARFAFAPLHQHAWVAGENDNLFWYNTAIAPIFTYLLLSGEREPVRNGILRGLFRGQEILISGRRPDWALQYAALDYLHKAAYLFQEGRPLFYRERTGLDTTLFRLGQSFWPEEHLKPSPPTELTGRWSIHPLPQPAWDARGSGIPFAESFYFGSFRSSVDDSGDFILLDGFNGASRNPYHTFAILELRLDGHTVLQGYRNQVLTRADGMVEPQVAMDAALRHHDVVGNTAVAVGEVPRAAFCNWRRTLAQRVGRYALVVDDLAFRTHSDNLEVQTLWEGSGLTWDAAQNAVRSRSTANVPLPAPWRRVHALEAVVESAPSDSGTVARLESLDALLLRATEPGAWLDIAFVLKQPFTGEVYADFLDYTDRGTARLFLDGKRVGPDHEHYSPVAERTLVSLGRHRLAAGRHHLRVQVVARRPGSDRCYVGISGVGLRPDGAPPAPRAAASIFPCDVLEGKTNGTVTTLEWRGAAKQGER